MGFNWIIHISFMELGLSNARRHELSKLLNKFCIISIKDGLLFKKIIKCFSPILKKENYSQLQRGELLKKMGFFKLRKPHPSWTDPNWFVCWYQCPKRFWTSPRYLLNVTKHWLLLGICVHKKVFMTNLNFIYQVPTCKKSEKIKELLLYQLLKLT